MFPCLLLFQEASECGGQANDTGKCFRTEYSSDVFRGVTAFCFFTLSFSQGIFAWKVLIHVVLLSWRVVVVIVIVIVITHLCFAN